MSHTVQDGNHWPRVRISKTAWLRITAAVEAAARTGLSRSGAPDETPFLPLCLLRYREGIGNRAPRVERTALADLEALEVTQVLLPPAELVEQGPTRIRFRAGAGGWARAQQCFDEEVGRALAGQPRSEVLARGHSHPFDRGRTWPSSLDRIEHLLPCLRYNRVLGLDAGFTLIALRSAGGAGWVLQGFATDDGVRVLDLGLAEILEEDPPPGLGAGGTPGSAGLAREAALREHFGARLAIDRLELGWSRYRLRAGQDPAAPVETVVLTPPDFPAEPGRLLRRSGERWEMKQLTDWPAGWQAPSGDLAGIGAGEGGG